MTGSISLLHAFESQKAASSDATKIDGPKWNAEHNLQQSLAGLLGATGGGPVVVLEAAEARALLEVYSQAEADAEFLTAAEADALFLTPAEADALFLTPAEGNAAYQPLDSDLTAIAALSTQTYGRSLLTLPDADALADQISSLIRSNIVFNVLDYGAVGDGSTDDLAAIQEACDEAADAGGGIVWVPPTGAAYVVSGSIEEGAGVHLVGPGTKNFPGEEGTVAQWTERGTWIRSTSTTEPTVVLDGHGAGCRGINFIRNQQTPSATPSTPYTPTTFPYEIKVFANFFTIEDVLTVGTTHDVWIAYDTDHGGGAYSPIHNLYSGALTVGIKFDHVNDTLHVSNLRHRGLFYESNSNIVDYRMDNSIGWDVGYLDNIQGHGIEFLHSGVAMLFANQTCLGNTHSMKNAALTGVQFSLVGTAMEVTAGDTDVSGVLTNVSAQSGPGFGSTVEDDLFNLASDAVNLQFVGLLIPDAGGRIMVLGNGSGGRVSITDLDVFSYSSAGAGHVGFAVATGAELRIDQFDIVPDGAAGAMFTGEVAVGVRTDPGHDEDRILKTEGSSGKLIETGVEIDSSNNLFPSTNDGGALGTNSNRWSDLLLASSGELDWNNDTALTRVAAGLVAVEAGLLPGVQFSALTASRTGNNNTTAQPIFGTSQDAFTALASTTYFFRAKYVISRTAGTTAHEIETLFAGTATFTSINYVATASYADGDDQADVVQREINVATGVGIVEQDPGLANGKATILLEGIMRVNGGGTIIPQFRYTATPGGTPTIRANTYFTLWPMGSNTVAQQGAWA